MACLLRCTAFVAALIAYVLSTSPSQAALLISEVLFNEVGADLQGEWIEIVNTGSVAIDLSGYKIGDEETMHPPTPAESGGMWRFPANASIGVGEVQIIAVGATRFESLYGFRPTYEVVNTNGLVPDLTHYNEWSNNPMNVINMGNVQDQALILDANDVRVVEVRWGGPGELAGTLPDGHSYEQVNVEVGGGWILGGPSTPGSVSPFLQRSADSVAKYNSDGVVSARKQDATNWVLNDMGYEPPDPFDRRYRIARVVGSEGNFAAVNTNGLLSAWNDSNLLWTNHDGLAAHPLDQIDGRFKIKLLVGSAGNFAAANNNGEIAIWNSSNPQQWAEEDDLGSHPFEDTRGRFRVEAIYPSNGNFAATNNNGEVLVWNHATSYPMSPWSMNSGLGVDPNDVLTRRRIAGVVDSLGNFAAYNDLGRVAAWNQETSDWTDFTFGIDSSIFQVMPSDLNFLAIAADGRNAFWDHDTSQWTQVTAEEAIVMATGSGPQPNALQTTTPTPKWSTSGNWTTGNQPTIGSVVDIANTSFSIQELTVDTFAIGYSVKVQGSAGTMRLDLPSEGTLSLFDGARVEGGGEILLRGGAVVGDVVEIVGGSIRGNGRIRAAVQNSGLLSPGASPGAIVIEGNYEQSASGAVLMEIGGILPADDFDRLTITGMATLNGALAISLIDEFVPAAGHSFDLFDWTSVNGAFSMVTLPTLAATLTWDTSRLYDDGVIAVRSIFADGDFNQDSSVDALDLAAWRDAYGQTNVGDADRDGDSDGGDFLLWQRNLGTSQPFSPVPEPNAVILVAIVVSFVGRPPSHSRRGV
jgi:hypothetical protein